MEKAKVYKIIKWFLKIQESIRQSLDNYLKLFVSLFLFDTNMKLHILNNLYFKSIFH